MVTNVTSSTDYEALDRVLDIVEPRLLWLAAEHGLVGTRIERWRWDAPGIVLVWVDRERHNIAKDIHVSIAGDSPLYELVVELNAWLDDPEKRTRKWRHQRSGTVPLDIRQEPGTYTSALANALETAYEVVSPWDRTSLTRKHPLTIP